MTQHQIDTLKQINDSIYLPEVIEWANENNVDYGNWTDIELYIAYGEAHNETT